MNKALSLSLIGGAAVILQAFATPVMAQTEDAIDNAGPNLEQFSERLGGRIPDSIAETPVAGLYELVLGSQIMYLSESGQYALQGDLYDLTAGDNITENRRNDLRAATLQQLSADEMIVFPAEDEKYQVSVFTDIDCGYCRKLHSEISAYNDQGITVRYLAFPRAGVNSESYNKAVSAWCADNPQAAMTAAKLGQDIPEKTCPNPVAKHYELGQQLGVRGTPSILLNNGEMVPGYVPAARLAQSLANTQ